MTTHSKTNMKFKIKFSHDYPKLWKQKYAQLIDVIILSADYEIDEDLIEYDTKTCGGEYYKLPKLPLLQLIFLGNKGIPFCTLRRYVDGKYDYYDKLIDELFEIVITQNQGKVK